MHVSASFQIIACPIGSVKVRVMVRTPRRGSVRIRNAPVFGCGRSLYIDWGA